MKRFLHYLFAPLLILSLSLTLLSCNRTRDRQDPSDDTENKSERVERKESAGDKAETDSIPQKYVTPEELGSLKQDFEDEIGTLKDQIRDLQSRQKPYLYPISVAALVLAIAALVLSYFYSGRLGSKALNKAKSVSDKLEKYKSQTDHRRESGSGGGSSKSLEKKIADLEARIADLEKRPFPSGGDSIGSYGYGSKESYSSQRSPQSRQRTIYSKENSNTTFTDLHTSKIEGSIFMITYEEGKREGTFDLISIDALRGNNEWTQVIDYAGGVALNDATGFRTKEPGKCRLNSNGKYWDVTRNLRIVFTK